MIKKLAGCLKQYSIYALLTPIFVIGEVFLEVSIPLLMANIIDIGVENGDVNYILMTGLTMDSNSMV